MRLMKYQLTIRKKKDVKFEELDSKTESDISIKEESNSINDSSEESEDEYENTENEKLFFFMKNTKIRKKSEVK